MKIHRGKEGMNARIIRFADGDTCIVMVCVGFGIWVEKYLRLEGIESWELNSSEDARALTTAQTLSNLYQWTPCIVFASPRGRDMYGRLRGRITTEDGDLAARIVDMKLAWFVNSKNHGADPQKSHEVTPGSTNGSAYIL